MNTTDIPAALRAQVEGRLGRAHAYDRLDPVRTGLVVVDMQAYFMAPGMPACCDAARDIVPNINRLAETLRGAGGRIYWIVTEALPEAAGDWANLYELMGKDVGAARYDGLAADSEGYALWSDLDVRDGDETVIKTRYSAIIEGSSDLEARARAAGLDTLIIVGVATNVCCEATARDAMMKGFRTIMVSDANAATTDEAHNATLRTFYALFGDVQTTEETIEFLEAGARNAEVAAE